VATSVGNLTRTLSLIRAQGLKPSAIRISKQAADELIGHIEMTEGKVGDVRVLTQVFGLPVYYADIPGIEVCVDVAGAITYPAGG
jgi:hypothetical protein